MSSAALRECDLAREGALVRNSRRIVQAEDGQERYTSGNARDAPNPFTAMELTATFTNKSHEAQPPYAQSAAHALSRAEIRREYAGEMTGESIAEALICQTAPNRMAYVGVDRFSGTFRGRRGGFVFQHGGIIEAGTFRPFGYIVPGSGTDELTGIRGDCIIRVTAAGEHTVTFIYELTA